MENRDARVSADAADDVPTPPWAAVPLDQSDGNQHDANQFGANQTGASQNTDPERPEADRSRSRSGHRSRSHRSHHQHGHSSTGGGGSRYDRQRRQTLIARLIATAAIVASVILSMLYIHARSQLATHNMETGTLASELSRARGELVQTKQLVAAQEIELGALLKQRIPGVTALEFEKLNDIDKGYVKKLMFSESGTGAERHLTYNAVIKNTEDHPITPAVNVLLFDRKGLQTGIARLTPAATTIPSRDEKIQPGETRSYSGLVERIRDGDPHAYYLVEVK